MIDLSILLFAVVVLLLVENKLLGLLLLSVAVNIWLLFFKGEFIVTPTSIPTEGLENTLLMSAPTYTSPAEKAFEEWDRMRLPADAGSIPLALPDPAVRQYNADARAIELMRQRGTRNQLAIDGLVTKDASYYAYHFGNDFQESEHKPWWGRDEY